MASEYCGLGVCAAEAGHAGTCAQASGWDEEPLHPQVVMRSYSDHVRQWAAFGLRPQSYARWVHYVLEGTM